MKLATKFVKIKREYFNCSNMALKCSVPLACSAVPTGGGGLQNVHH
jgi:hypothetical protein